KVNFFQLKDDTIRAIKMNRQKKACRRQHTIPQFLLKGFASRTQGSRHFAFLFRKASEVCEPNIENIGLVNSFYSMADDNSIDELLTLKESRYAALVAQLRQGYVSGNDKQLIDEFEKARKGDRQLFWRWPD